MQVPEKKSVDLPDDKRVETREQSVMRLLAFLADADGPVSSDENWLPSDLKVMKELEIVGLISAAEILHDRHGVICAIAEMRINPAGRMYLDLDKFAEKAGATDWPERKEVPGFSFFAWALALIGAAIGWYIMWRFMR